MPDEAEGVEEAEAPPEEKSAAERRKDIRVRKRLDEADEVSALLEEAFGPQAIAEAEEKVRTGEYLPAFRRGGAAAELEHGPREQAPTLYARAYNRVQDALEAAGLSVEALLVVFMTTIALWAFSFSHVMIVGCVGVMMILAVLRVRPLNLLALGGLFLLTWEVADIARQWDRLGGIVERLLQ